MIRKLTRWQKALIAAGLLVTLVISAGAAAGPPLRNWFVREGNQRLVGYTLSVGSMSFHPWSLALLFRDLRISQDAHPQPEILRIPAMRIDIEWLALLRGRVVARSLIDSPVLNVDVAQLQAEVNDRTALRQRGWQRLPELYPLDINAVIIRNATLTYLAQDAERPLRISQAQVLIRNIRHVQASGARYPSPVHATAVVFESGKATFDGDADFLRYARPAYRGAGKIHTVPLDILAPFLKGYPLRFNGGTLAAEGEVESNPEQTQARLSRVRIDNIRVDYLGGSDEAKRKAALRLVRAAGRAAREPTVQLQLDDLQVQGEFGFVNLARTPSYRLFLRDATMSLTNVANHDKKIESSLLLKGLLMGSGRTTVRGSFRAGPGPPDFAVDIRSLDTELPALNPMLRAHARLDVAKGNFSLYSQILSKGGHISGYVKPLFNDVKIYDRDQDEDKTVFRQLYEIVADGIRQALESRHRHEVATVATLSGTISEPNTSTPQVIGNMLRSAFVEAIVPGFDQAVKQPTRK